MSLYVHEGLLLSLSQHGTKLLALYSCCRQIEVVVSNY